MIAKMPGEALALDQECGFVHAEMARLFKLVSRKVPENLNGEHVLASYEGL